MENKLIGYAADSQLMAVVSFLRVSVGESPNRLLGKVCESCDLRGMKLNTRKTKTITVSWSCTMVSQSVILTIISGSVLNESDDLDILGVTLYSKITFEKHLRSVSRAVSRRLGILR